jgi:hypothetical protein
MKMKMTNDKVVGFYKKVLTDIRRTISAERQQVKRYLNNWFKLKFYSKFILDNYWLFQQLGEVCFKKYFAFALLFYKFSYEIVSLFVK